MELGGLSHCVQSMGKNAQHRVRAVSLPAVILTVCLVPILLFLPIAFLSAQVSLKV